MNQSDCPFCRPASARIWLETSNTITLFDAFPVTEGHALVIPKRHVASLFDLAPGEQAELWAQVAEVRRKLADRYSPDGFNVGLNDGAAAGQTVMHAHIHVIPRRSGDVPDPRGGIRWIIPDKARYW